MFWLDEEIGADVFLDGVITVVDSKHCLQQMKETRDNGALNEWLRQVGVADMVIVNKTDLVTEEMKDNVIFAVRSINRAAKLLTTVKSVEDVEELLDLRDSVDVRPDTFEPSPGNHLADSHVSTVSLYCDGVTRLEQFDSFMADLLWEKELYPGMEVLRVKGIVAVKGEESQLMVQGVHDTYDTYKTKLWGDTERKNTLGRKNCIAKLI